MKRFIALTVICAVTLTGCATIIEPSVPDKSGQQEEQVQVRPQDDFYRYVNEDSLKDTEFEYGETSAGESAAVQDMVMDEVYEIIREVAAGRGYESGSEEDIIQKAYNLYIDYDFDNSPVPDDIAELLGEIRDADSLHDILAVDAYMYREYGVGNLLNVGTADNYLVPGRTDLCFKNYSGILNAGFEDLTDSYTDLNSVKSTGSTVMQYLGSDKASAEQYGTDLAYVVMDIYNSTDMAIIRDSMPLEYFFAMTPDEAQQIFTNVDLDEYLTELGYDLSKCDKYYALDRGQLEGINSILTEENLSALKAWETAKLIKDYTEFITPSSDILLQYYQKDYRAAEERALETVALNFSDQTDPLYTERYYTDEMDESLRSMCDDIREGYRSLITDADWLTEETREGLLTKLDNIVYVTASDMTRHDNDEFKQVTGSNYYELIHAYRRLLRQQSIDGLGEETSRTEIRMPMQMVNACYLPSLNNITITAAIMNAPYYDINADYYTNLGGIGSIIAHEMGHAFDSNCIVFDSNGRFDPSWLLQSDIDALEARNSQAVSYFTDNFTVFGVYHVDGEQTLGENYADLGGMECIASLAHTQEQREALFTGYAVCWSEKQVDTAVLDQLDHDEHSPAVIRVNAVLATVDEFYETYDVTEGDGMYIAPENRISRWH